MQCESVRQLTDAYLDGELPPQDVANVSGHLQGCPACSSKIAEDVRLRNSVRSLRNHFEPSAEFRAKMQKQFAAPRRRAWLLPWISVAAAVATIVLAVSLYLRHPDNSEAFAEAADLHVNALASANQVDVVSTDRHTVKPWFQGRIPFSFNVPELNGSEFSLVGGRMVYFHQQPGAQLIVAYGQHRISVLIFQNTADMIRAFPEVNAVDRRTSFDVETWRSSNLRFIFVSDAEPSSIHRLAQRFKDANN